MPKKKRTRKAPPNVRVTQPVTKVGQPADIVSLIPYLLGHEPNDSVVVVSLVGPRRRFGPCVRLDLVALDQTQAFAVYVSDLVERQGWTAVICAAYSDDRAVVDALMVPLTARLSSTIAVIEALGVGHGRWWSYTCSDPSCCPVDGTPFDPTTSSAVAVMVAEGRPKAASRDALRGQFAPRSNDVRRETARRCQALIDKRGPDEQSARWTPAEVHERILACQGVADLSLDSSAELLAMVQTPETRDIAWTMMTRSNAAQHLALWSQVTRTAPDRLLAPAGSLAGFAAWLSGEGVLASHAADRVSEVDPTYSMVLLLREILGRGVDPDLWKTTLSKPLGIP
jgi:hypothetical protein